MSVASASGRSRPGFILSILVLVYVFNLVDRLIISILAPPIQTEFQLSDTQLGLLGGIAFALLYATLGVPIAWLADRYSRVKIISTAVAVWSAFTALCGLAQNFWQLFLARMGVGVGEAGGIAPSYSLITDYFRPDQRARALAIFTIGSPIGSCLGIVFGGWIAVHMDWRAAFVIIGLAGLPLAALVRIGITEPPRGGLDQPGPSQVPSPPFRQIVRTLTRTPSFWLISLGGAFSNIPIYGLLFWLPSYFQRTYEMDLAQVSVFYGTIILVGGIVGMWIGGWLGDRLGGRNRSAYCIIPAVTFLLAAPFYGLALFAPSIYVAWFLFVVPQSLAFFYAGPMLTAVQHIVAPSMRATASASFLFVANIIGTGFGTVFVGWVSDTTTSRLGDDGLRFGILCALAFYIVAAVLFAFAAKRLPKDWYIAP